MANVRITRLVRGGALYHACAEVVALEPGEGGEANP